MKRLVGIFVFLTALVCSCLAFAACGECEHGNLIPTVTREATCVAAGERTYKCADCDEIVRTEVIPATGIHTYSDSVTEATCDDGGYTTHTCTVCDYSFTDTETAAKGHDYVDTTVNPTVSSEGYTEHKCNRCDYSYRDNVVPKLSSHIHSYTAAVTEATCLRTGFTTYTCSCGDSYIGNETPVKDHEYIVDHVVKATCLTAGYTVHRCKWCDDSYNDTPVEALGHDWGNVPSCADHVCLRCEEHGAPASGHNYVQVPTLGRDPTCEEAGSMTFRCIECGDEYEQEVPATGHSGIVYSLDHEEQGDGCTVIEHYVGECGLCHEPVTRTVTREKHNYSATITKAATCSKDGEKMFTCSVCGDHYTEAYSDANAHKWDAGAVNGNITTYTCEYCGVIKTAVSAKTETTTTVDKNDLTSAGEVELKDASISINDSLGAIENANSVRVSADAKSVDELDINMTPADRDRIGDSKIYNLMMYLDDNPDPTTELGGTVTVRVPYELAEGEDPDCIVVWYIDELGGVVFINAKYSDGYAVFETTHFSYYTVTKLTAQERCDFYGHVLKTEHHEATCTADGFEFSVCLRCGQKTTTDVVPALGHDMHDVTVDPTCTEDGHITSTCSRCDLSLTIKIPSVGHNWQAGAHTDPTCTAAGRTVYTCSDCGESYTYTIAATGHKYKDSRVEPTCTLPGVSLGECTECGHKIRYGTIPATGHDFTETVYAATCTTGGYTVKECSHCHQRFESERTATLPHTWDISSPTCGRGQVCLVCGMHGAAATGNHAYENGVCTVCGTGCEHSWDAGAVTAATCQHGGYTTYTCGKCGAVRTDNHTGTVNHVYENIATEAATCTEGAYTVKRCKHCNRRETVYTSAPLGHDFGVDKCSRCDEPNPDADDIYMNMLGSLNFSELGFKVEDVHFELRNKNVDSGKIEVPVSVDVDLCELTFGFASDGKLVGKGYGFVAVDDGYSDAVYDVKAVIGSDRLYIIYDGSEGKQYIVLDGNFMANSLGMELFGNDSMTYAELCDCIKDYRDSFTELLGGFAELKSDMLGSKLTTLASRLFVSAPTADGLKFTVDKDKLAAVNTALTTMYVSDFVDYCLGEGTYDAIVKLGTDALNLKLKEAKSFVDDLGLDADAVISLAEKILTAMGNDIDIDRDILGDPDMSELTVAEMLAQAFGGEGSAVVKEFTDMAERLRTTIAYEDEEVKAYVDDIIGYFDEATSIVIYTDKAGNIISINLGTTNASFDISQSGSYTESVYIDGALSVFFGGTDIDFGGIDVQASVLGKIGDLRIVNGTTCTVSRPNGDDKETTEYTFISDVSGKVTKAVRERIGAWANGRRESGTYKGVDAYYYEYEIDTDRSVYDFSHVGMISVSDDCGDWKSVSYTVLATNEWTRGTERRYYSRATNRFLGSEIVQSDEMNTNTYYSWLSMYYNPVTREVEIESRHNYEPDETGGLDPVGCTTPGYRLYRCTHCGDTRKEYYTNGHTPEVSWKFIDEKNRDCRAGVELTYTCKTCGEVVDKRKSYYHDMFEIERIDTSLYGGTCGGELIVMSCPCGAERHYGMSEHGCDMNINDWMQNDPETGREIRVVEGKCSVTHPERCRFGFRAETYYTADANCNGTAHVSLSLGLDANGDYNPPVTSTYPCGKRHTIESNVNDYTTDEEGYHVDVREEYERCRHCDYGFTYTDKIYYADKSEKSEPVKRKYERVQNDTFSSLREEEEYTYYQGVEAQTHYYREEESLAESRRWYEFTYEYDHEKCMRTVTETYSDGDKGESRTEEFHFAKSISTKEPTCTQPGVIERKCVDCSVQFESSEIAPRGHEWRVVEDGDGYVCALCGLHSEKGVDGTVIFEDLSKNTDFNENGGDIVIGYYKRDNFAQFNVSFSLVVGGENVENTVFSIDVTDDGYSLIRFDKPELLAKASEIATRNSITGDYDVRMNFVPIGGDFDFAITFTDLTA